MDEIVIVDTGSTDKTVSIAESFGARVYHHPWEHHFSKHRNQSFGYARGDWILYIDADEELLPGSGEALREAIKTEDDVDAVAVVLECIFGQGSSTSYSNAIRVFRNHRGLYYKGRVHNYIVGVKKAVCAPIHLFHHGYNLDKKTSLQKFQRTTELLKKDIAEDPANPRPHHFLGASYLSEGMFKEATEEAMEAVGLYEKKGLLSNNYLWSLYIASSAFFNLGEVETARGLAEKALKVFPNHADSHYMLALAAYAEKDRRMFEHHFEGYRRAKEIFANDPAQFTEIVNNTFGSEWMLSLFRGFFSMDEGDDKKALKEFEIARRQSPDMFHYHNKLGAYYKLSGKFDPAEEEYLKALELKPEDTLTLWSLSEVYQNLGRIQDQMGVLEKLLHNDPDFPNGRFNLGLAHMEIGNFEEALPLFQYIRSREENNIRAMINETLCLRCMGRTDESIQLSKSIHTSGRPEQLVLISNLAHCYYETGQGELAIESFRKMAEMDPDALEPPVYLSMLLLENKEIEGCVTQSNRLLSLLGVEENIVLSSLADLGEQYLKAGRLLVASQGQSGMGKICFDISIMLGYNTPEVIAEIGATLIQAGETGAGVQLLRNVLSMAPQSRKVKAVVTEAIKHLKEMTVS